MSYSVTNKSRYMCCSEATLIHLIDSKVQKSDVTRNDPFTINELLEVRKFKNSIECVFIL